MPFYFIFAVIAVVISVFVIRTAKRNKEINQNGIETFAVVTRVKKNESVDSDGFVSVSTLFYVTYQTQDGQTVEAQLASGKSIDNRIGRAWDDDLHEGSRVRIKYLPAKPNYVIRLSED